MNFDSIGLNCEAKTLELGDMIWIGRTDSGAEFVLDTILERKTVSDLCSSIIDGRYAGCTFHTFVSII